MELERFSPGRRVADVACGEGYGSALLSGSAASVVGIDADAATVAHARRRYGGLPRIEFRAGRCEALPLSDAGLDLLVSFETQSRVPGARGRDRGAGLQAVTRAARKAAFLPEFRGLRGFIAGAVHGATPTKRGPP